MICPSCNGEGRAECQSLGEITEPPFYVIYGFRHGDRLLTADGEDVTPELIENRLDKLESERIAK